MSSDAKIEVRWQVEDGYCGKSRHQNFDLDLEDFAGCESEVEYEHVLDGAVQEEFENRIAWRCDNYEDIIAAAMLYNETEDE